MKENTGAVHAQVPVDVGTFLLNEKRADVQAVELRHKVNLILIPNTNLETPAYEVVRLRHDQLNTEEVAQPSYKMVEVPQREEYMPAPFRGPAPTSGGRSQRDHAGPAGAHRRTETGSPGYCTAGGRGGQTEHRPEDLRLVPRQPETGAGRRKGGTSDCATRAARGRKTRRTAPPRGSRSRSASRARRARGASGAWRTARSRRTGRARGRAPATIAAGSRSRTRVAAPARGAP